MDRLEDLARRELAILQRAEAVAGDMADADRRLREAGVYAEAAAIHAAYVELAAPPESSLEALKRAVFLAWYAEAEPPCLTGVGDLDERAVRRTHELLAEAHEAGRIDDELAAMLGYYRGVTDRHFTNSPLAGRLGFVAALEGHQREYPYPGFRERDHGSRGQMGRYWIAMVGSHAGRARWREEEVALGRVAMATGGTASRLLFWAPRGLCVVFAGFLGSFAMDGAGTPYDFWHRALALLVHLVPSAILLVALVIVWRREWIGAILFPLLAILHLATNWGRLGWAYYAVVDGPLLALGVLFLMSWLSLTRTARSGT